MTLSEDLLLSRIRLFMLTALIALLGFSISALAFQDVAYADKFGDKFIAEIQEDVTDSAWSIAPEKVDDVALPDTSITIENPHFASTANFSSTSCYASFLYQLRARSPPPHLPV